MLLTTLREASASSLSTDQFAYEVIKLMYGEIKSKPPVVYLSGDLDLVKDYVRRLDTIMTNIEYALSKGAHICSDDMQIELSSAQVIISRLSWYY